MFKSLSQYIIFFVNFVKEWSQTIAAIASVIIAILAYSIEKELADQNVRIGAINRTIAIYNNMASSDYYRFLIEKSSKSHIQGVILELNSYITAKAIFDDKEEFRIALDRLLMTANNVYECSGFQSDWSESGVFLATIDTHPTYELCDRDTVIKLFGNTLATIFFKLRPIIYCDIYFSKLNSSGYKNYEKLENLVAEYLSIIDEQTVFLYYDDLKKKIDADRENKVSLRLQECDKYFHNE